MKLKLIRVAKGRLAWADEAAAIYAKRLGRYAPFEEVTLRPSGPGAEARRILRALRPGDRLIALDERGEALDSRAWAAGLDAARQAGVGTLWFAIGGPDGHAPELRRRAHAVWSIAPMVLAHQVARIVVLEQLYRSWTLIRGEPYHR